MKNGPTSRGGYGTRPGGRAIGAVRHAAMNFAGYPEAAGSQEAAESPAGPAVSVASVAWEAPGLDAFETLKMAYRNRRQARPPAQTPRDAELLLRNVCAAVLARAGRRGARADPELARLMVGSRHGRWPRMRNSFRALVWAFRAIHSGQSQRVMVAGQPRFGDALGACAVLLEAERCMDEALRERGHLNLLGYAEGRADMLDGARVLALLERHVDKTLYIGPKHVLRPALGVIAGSRRLDMEDLGVNLPPDVNCQCLMQLIAMYELHATGAARDEPGAVFANDGAPYGGAAGILIVAPVGDPVDMRLAD